ncbi:MAG: glycosyltransferase family 4 protein [Kiritimatiellae bacterium]|nr:glycosyltransferase family 4 protein [Kiritimatiellia bacterium]
MSFRKQSRRTFCSTAMILTNQAFVQSPRWTAAVTSICAEGESPDTLPPLVQAVRLLRGAPRARVVLTMGPRASLAYGLLAALLGRRSRQVLCEVFLDDEWPQSWRWRAKTALYRFVARRAEGVIVNSTPEIAEVSRRWGIPEERVRFVPICTTVAEPRAVPAEEPPTVVCAGRTLRDLPTLFAAVPSIRAQVVLITSGEQKLPGPVPENVTVLRDLPLDEFRARLAAAAVVALPLLPAPRSTGQVVFLEAMSFGKPVVTTRAHGTVDYIRDGVDGLLVPPGDPEAMAAAVNAVLDDPGLAGRLSAGALEAVRGEFSPDTHALRRLAALKAFG